MTPHGNRRSAARDAAIILEDGRRVTYREFGPDTGRPVIALHGTPGSRLKFAATEAAAHKLGLRVIAPDRWAYGGSDAHPAPSLEAYAEDVEALADSLGLQRFALLGVSGGGPYAAATAVRLVDRVSALALAAPVGPIADEPALVMTPFHRFCFGPLARSPRAVSAVFAAFNAVLRRSPNLAMRISMLRAATADRSVLGRGATRERLAATFIEGLRPGTQGPAIDLAIFGSAWRLDVSRASAPSRLWLGSADLNIPLASARLLAGRLPNCQLIEMRDHGHLWVADNYPVVLGWIEAQGP